MTAGRVGAGVIAGRKRLATIVLALAVLALPASSPAAPGWGAPRNLSPPGRDASSPQVALNAAGTAVAVWRLRVSRSTGVVQAAVREPGGTWGVPRDISTPSEVDQSGSQPVLHVALDPGGDAVAIWTQHAGGFNSVVTAVLQAGGDWSTPQQLSTPGRTALGPRVALDSSGNAVAIWSEYQSPYWWETRVLTAARSAGGTWSATQSISTDDEPALASQVAVDRVGTAFAVWNAGRHCTRGVCRYAVQASVRPAGGTWSAPQDLSSDSYYEISAPQVVVDESGNALAVWSRDAWFPNGVIESVDRPSGGQWSSPEVLPLTYGTATGPRLAVDPAGNAVAVWSTGAYPSKDVVASTRPARGTWEAPRVLSASNFENSRPDVAVDAAGVAVVIWERNNIVWIAERSARGTWGRPQKVSSLGRYAFEPEIALGAAGSGVLVWHEFDGSNEVVQAVARPGPRPCVVPKVVGKTLVLARAAIVASNCRTGRIARTSSKARKGQVLSQSPTAGQILKGGTRVKLAVSRGRRP